MKFTVKIFLIFLISFFASSCSENSDNNTLTPLGSNNESDFQYPVKINSFWYYETRNFIYNIRPDSIGIYFSTDTIRGYGNARIEKDTVINSDTLFQLRNSHSTAGHAHSTLELYKQTDTGLIRVAFYSDGTNFGPFRPVNNFTYSLNNNTFSSVNELVNYYNNYYERSDTSLVFDDPPVKVIQYPVAENSEWNIINYGTTRVYKEYLNYENATVPAGTFFCIKIKRDVYYNNPVPDTSYFYYDYFSEKGMVKRDILIKDVNISNKFGITIGKIDIKEETFLNLYNIP